ncbi:MAG TPA: hypothetical protein VL500_01065 [Candidatus Eisenbacteria bacterium]|nr:hypothetical protein [Candidatus Eisenbacteria bacterium]
MSTQQERLPTDDAENAAARAMIVRVVGVIQPVIDRIAGRDYRLAPGNVEFEEVRTAVFMATGVFPRSVEFVSQDTLSPNSEPAYIRTLDRSIETLFGFRLLTALGNKKWQSHRRHFGYEEAIPLFVALQPDALKLPRECFRSALFHFWGAALARQEQLLERLIPLVTLLPKAIPLGERRDRPGTWRVMVA